MKRSLLLILILIIASLPSIFPLFNKGFFESDDGEWMIIRFSAFHEALRDGQIPVRFLSRLNYGYGYPVSNFLYPGFMYLAEPIHLLGFGFVDTIKIILGLSMIGSTIFCFLWLSKKFTAWSAFVGAVIYLYAPYHLFNIYKRGSVGEILAICILPFILWQIERRSFLFTSLGIGLLMISHNTLALLFLPVIIIYRLVAFYSKENKKYLMLNTLYLILISLSISSFFWIPAIFDLQYTVFSQTKVSDWQNYFSNIQLIGLVTIVIFIAILVLFIFQQFFKNGFSSNTTKYYINVSIFLLLSGLLSLFLSTSLSGFVWQILPVSFIQFPFRFLSLTILCVAFLSAIIINQLKDNLKVVSMIMLFLLLGFSAMPYMKPAVFFDKGDSYYATNEATTTVQNEYMQKWVKSNPKEHFKNKVEITNGKITNLKVWPNKILFTTNSPKDSVVTINIIYFDGWRAKVDGTDVPISYSNEHGVIKINVSSGVHDLGVRFGETPLRLISDFTSLISLLMLVMIAKNKRVQERLSI